jgi:hypothetical protein
MPGERIYRERFTPVQSAGTVVWHSSREPHRPMLTLQLAQLAIDLLRQHNPTSSLAP